MRIEFNSSKSELVKNKHGISLAEAAEIFDQVYLTDRKSDDPEQFRAIGWCCGQLCAVIFEIKHDNEDEFYRLTTAWKATKEEQKSYAENI